MIHVFSDDPDGGERLAQLKSQLGSADLQSLNTAVFDGQRLTLEELVAACETMPFLSERRLIVVRGLLGRYEPKRDWKAVTGGSGEQKAGKNGGGKGQRSADAAREWREYFARLPETAELVFLEGMAISNKNALYKGLLEAKAELAQTPVLQGDALAGWIERRVAAKGGRLAPGVARLIASFNVDNLRSLDQELDKLVAYSGAEPIDARAVNQLVTGAREVNVYKMADAFAEGDGASALRRFHDLLADGESPLYLLSMFVRQFRLLVQVKELREKGMAPETIAGRLRTQVFVVERVLRQLSRFPTFEQLEYVYRRLLDGDWASKTGRGDLVLHLELLITEVGRRR